MDFDYAKFHENQINTLDKIPTSVERGIIVPLQKDVDKYDVSA